MPMMAPMGFEDFGEQHALPRLRRLPSWLFSKMALRGTRLTTELLGDTSLRSDFAVLSALETFGPISQAELGRRLDMDRSDVVAVLNRLEHDRYVRRDPDPHDRRRNRIHLMPSGQRHLDELERRFDQVQDALLRPLSEVERGQLTHLLQRLLDQGGLDDLAMDPSVGGT